MSSFDIRKTVVMTEAIRHDGGPTSAQAEAGEAPRVRISQERQQ